jgi:hypothetical protein
MNEGCLPATLVRVQIDNQLMETGFATTILLTVVDKRTIGNVSTDKPRSLPLSRLLRAVLACEVPVLP